MAEITKAPTDLPSTNELDKHDTGDGTTPVAYIGLSATNVKIENPPELEDSGILVIRWTCTDSGNKLMKDGEIRPKRTLTVTSAWWPGNRPLPQDPNQEALFEDDVDAANKAEAENYEDAEGSEGGTDE
ncbi:hypothetical protein [Mycobacteroides abscessus]|uniref:hypothetical protein n=1 Tax=Mycobacteroides abscessus TaxID=36809 RepID=UPI0009281CBC|nr:hypothetical protein [Mycobacteroides abscessus]SHP52982.1 Uncharacterised protein [Mycobacteroides abscessus subsp. abscessus]